MICIYMHILLLMNYLIFLFILFLFLFCFVGILHGVFHIEERIAMTKNKKLSMFHNVCEQALTASGVVLFVECVKFICFK